MYIIAHNAVGNIIQFNQGTESQHSHTHMQKIHEEMCWNCVTKYYVISQHHSHSDKRQITVKLADDKSTGLTRTHNWYEISKLKTGSHSRHW